MLARDARQVSWAEADTTGFTTTSSQPASSRMASSGVPSSSMNRVGTVGIPAASSSFR